MSIAHHEFDNWLDARQRMLETEKVLNQELLKADPSMTVQEIYACHYIAEAEAAGKTIGVNQLAHVIGLSQSATSRMLQKFETACGVLQKNEAVHDKRARHMELTAEGYRVLEIAYAIAEHIFSDQQQQED